MQKDFRRKTLAWSSCSPSFLLSSNYKPMCEMCLAFRLWQKPKHISHIFAPAYMLAPLAPDLRGSATGLYTVAFNWSSSSSFFITFVSVGLRFIIIMSSDNGDVLASNHYILETEPDHNHGHVRYLFKYTNTGRIQTTAYALRTTFLKEEGKKISTFKEKSIYSLNNL